MTVLKLPEEHRPTGVFYKKCALGVDLSASFVGELRGLDEHLYPVWHQHKLLWDNVINDVAGAIEDPRYTIESKFGELNFGFVLTDGKGRPRDDGHWHVWRLCRGYGWAHVVKLESNTDQVYLNLVVRSLYLQDRFNTKYRGRGYSKYLEGLDIQKRHKEVEAARGLQGDIMKANSAIMGRVMENFSRNVTAPTRPTKDVIMSGAGISKRARITREITDREGGLILPDNFGNEGG